MKLTVIMAMTVDGKIGINDNHFPDWTGKADKRLFKEITMRAGVIIMGSKTFDVIGRPLPGRKNIVMTRNPQRRSQWENLIFTSKSPKELLEDLEQEGFREAILAGGAKINTLFANNGLINDLIVTYAPKTFGHGLSLFSNAVFMNLKLNDLKLLEDGAIFAHYKVIDIDIDAM
ncbi:MAG: dihydrofolate reductase family protein [Desulfobacteraceae bacterium]|jgi:dihydrofolate reductase